MNLAPKETVFEAQDIEVEQSVLGLLIQDASRVPHVAQFLEDWHFADPLHQRIYAQIMTWSLTDQPITALTMSAAMKADPGIASIEPGRDYFHHLVMAAPVITPIKSLALIVRNLALRRNALSAMEVARQQLTTTATDVREALRDVVTVADEVERIAVGDRFQSTLDAANDAIREVERASAGKPVRAVRAHLMRLNNETGGFYGADFIVIAGKSGMGKSALMGGISWNAAAAMYPTIVFSLEMKRAQWTQRLLTDIDFSNPDIDGTALHYRKFRASGVDINGRSNGFSAEEFARIMFARDRLADFHPWLEIHDEDGLTVAQIAARARAFQQKWKNDPRIRDAQGTPPDEDPIGLVVVDYIQIVDPGAGQGRNREQEVAGIARGLKGLAKRLDWPVMAGSQLNEDDKGRNKDSKRPQGGDVRESKAIFHESDIMLAPYRQAEALYQARPDAAPGEPAWNAWNAEMKIARHHFDLIGLKNRMGRRFTLDLWGEMAASAVRDEKPARRGEMQMADDLIGYSQGAPS